jgi:hypothetical protein
MEHTASWAARKAAMEAEYKASGRRAEVNATYTARGRRAEVNTDYKASGRRAEVKKDYKASGRKAEVEAAYAAKLVERQAEGDPALAATPSWTPLTCANPGGCTTTVKSNLCNTRLCRFHCLLLMPDPKCPAHKRPTPK